MISYIPALLIDPRGFFLAIPLLLLSSVIFIVGPLRPNVSRFIYLTLFSAVLVSYAYKSWSLLGVQVSLFLAAFAGSIVSVAVKGSLFFSWRNLLYGILAIDVLNTVLWIIWGSYGSSYAGSGLLLSYLGIAVERPLFFWSGGVNHYGVCIGFFAALWWLSDIKYSTIAFIILGFTAIAIVDSRGSLAGLFAVACFRLCGWRYVKFVLIFPILISSFFVFIYFNFDFVGRNGSTLLSHRENIWLIAIQGLLEMSPSEIVFGLGASGYIHLDIGESILFYFADRGANLGSLHNAYLQCIFEFGVLGLFLFLIGFWLALSRILKFGTAGLMPVEGKLFLGGSVYLFTVASFESVFSVSYLPIFLTLAALFLTIRPQKPSWFLTR